MFKNKYYNIARLAPAAITAAPLIILAKVMLWKFQTELSLITSILPVLSLLGISTALIFLMVQLNRIASKEIFQKFYFKDELNMPTTSTLLHTDLYYHSSIKNKIRTKIESKYQISLLSPADEAADENAARKVIASAVSQIRISLKENSKLLQHNIEYGFFRNLIGGCFIAMLGCIIIYIIATIDGTAGLKTISILLFTVYLIPQVFSQFIMKRYGNYYSKILYEEFLSL